MAAQQPLAQKGAPTGHPAFGVQGLLPRSSSVPAQPATRLPPMVLRPGLLFNSDALGLTA